MILGVGTDIVEVDRIQKSCEVYGDRFLKRVFTESEIAYAHSKKNPYPSLAVRFAAKEALIKAARVGKFHVHGWTDAEVRMDASGLPSLALFRDLGDFLKGKKIHLSVSHSERYATATIIIED